MKPRFLFALLLAAAAAAAGGCRNQIKSVDTFQTDYEKELKKESFTAELLERNDAEGRFKYKFKTYSETQVKTFEVHSTVIRFTPYEWWRELYEVPMGLVLFPFGICGHVLNVATLGIFPYDWCWAADCTSFAGMNPAMNIEDEKRYEDEPQKMRREMVDNRLDVMERSSDHQTVRITSGDAKALFKTNKAGIVDVLLLDDQGNGPTLSSSDRHVDLYAGGSSIVLDSWVIPRELQERLKKGSSVIKAYRAIAKPSGKDLRKCVDELDRLGFITLAYQFGRNELHHRPGDLKFKEEYEK